MSAFSDNMVAVARRLLTKFGQTITFNRSVPGTLNPVTNTTAASSDSTYTGLSAPRDYTRFERDLESVQQDDIKLITEQTSVVPIIGDTFTLNSVSYAVLEVDQVVATGDTIIYILQGRI